MAEPGATPSHQFFAGFNAFFSPTWKKTRVEQVSLKVFHLWCILGHPNAQYDEFLGFLDSTLRRRVHFHRKIYQVYKTNIKRFTAKNLISCL